MVANVSNTVGIFVGTVGSVFGYRRELAGQRSRVLLLAAPSVLGGVLGAFLLLVLPQRYFSAIVPVLIGMAVVLVVVQPWLTRHLSEVTGMHAAARILVPLLTFLTCIYGGYFGAGQGVILMAAYLVLVHDSAQRLNAAKNVVSAIVNGTAAACFIVFARVSWEPALVIALSSLAGSQFGSHAGRRLSPAALRAVIVTAGVAGLVKVLSG